MGYIIRLSIANIKLRKLRTALTIVGIMIGIMSIVTMLTTGLGAKKTMMEEVEKTGSTKEIVVYSVNTQRKDRLLTDEVVKQIEKMDNVAGVYPVIEVDGYEKISGFYGWSSISGVPKEYMEYLALKEGDIPEKNGSRPNLLLGGGMRSGLYNEKTWQQFDKSSKAKESLVGRRIDFVLEDADFMNNSNEEDSEETDNSEGTDESTKKSEDGVAKEEEDQEETEASAPTGPAGAGTGSGVRTGNGCLPRKGS